MGVNERSAALARAAVWDRACGAKAAGVGTGGTRCCAPVCEDAALAGETAVEPTEGECVYGKYRS